MSNWICENCKYSSWFGNPIYIDRKLLCNKGSNTWVIGIDGRSYCKEKCDKFKRRDYIR